MKKSLLFTLMFFCAVAVLAQDKIYKKDQTVIECKVIEVGLDEVKYKETDIQDSPIISVAIESLLKVELSNGRVIEFKDPLTDPSSYVDDKKSAFKMHFFSPLLEHMSFAYERSIKPGRSFETTLGLIGVGFDSDEYNKSSGVALAAGYKFMRTPDFYSKRFKYAHILKGAYIKPQLLLSIYRNEYTESFYYGPGSVNGTRETDIVAGAFIINLGKQVIFDNFFLIDWSFGLGYGFSNQNDIDDGEFNESWRANHYGFLLGDDTFPIAVSASFKIGVLLK